jgi:predicted O-methyltransferase YrrM
MVSRLNFGETLQEVFGSQKESEGHPHVKGEKAELFRTIDFTATEIETLNFLNALVYSFKPKVVLETGTYKGHGTLSIAHALKINGFGKVITVEHDSRLIEQAKTFISLFDESLLNIIDFVHADSVAFTRHYSEEAFDFCFFDTELSCRYDELKHLRRNNKLSNNALCMFHDTSRTRTLRDYNKRFIKKLDKLQRHRQHLEFELSRGFRIIRLSR